MRILTYARGRPSSYVFCATSRDAGVGIAARRDVPHTQSPPREHMATTVRTTARAPPAAAAGRGRAHRVTRRIARARAKSSDLKDIERDVANAGSASLRVARAFTVAVERCPRSAREYVALPAKEYNLIDPSNVSRTDDTGFVVSAGRQKMLFLDVEPRGAVRVDATADGCEQQLVMAEIVNMKPEDSRSTSVVNAINASLKDLKLVNSVTCVQGPGGEEKIRVQITVAGDFTEGIFARAGGKLNTILGWSLGAVLPWFLTQLAADYGRWAKGEARTATNASLTEVAAKIIAGSRGKLPAGVEEVECEEVEL